MPDSHLDKNKSFVNRRRSPRVIIEHLETRALMSASPLATPAALTATAKSPTSIQLNWTDKDTAALGFDVLRSSDGVHFDQVGQVTSGKTTTFNDTTAAPDTTYTYQVKSYNNGNSSAASNIAPATTPLVAPTALTANAVSGTSVHLTWTDNDSSAAGYYVLRASDGTHFSSIANLSDANAAAYTDNTVVSGHTYTYEIQAYQGSVTSAVSTKSAANTPLAAPSNLTTTVKSANTVQLNWTDNDANAAGYYVLRSSDGNTFTQVGKVTSGLTATYTDTTAASLHSYTYKVEAFAGAIISPASNTATASTPLVIPTALTATAAGPGTIQLSWTDADPSAQGYNVFRSTNGVDFTQIAQVTNPKTTKFTDSTVSSDSGYSYRIRAYNGSTLSDGSNTASATTPLIAETGLTAAATSRTSVQLNWTDNDSNATGYYVLRSSDGTHFSQIANLTDANAASYTDNGVVSGHTYTYEVQGYNGSITSAFSAKASASTPLAAPSSLMTTVKGPTSVQLNWTDNDTNAAGYYVLRSSDGTNFTQVGKATSGLTATYIDTTTASLHSYTYKVEAFAGTIVSEASNTATATTPLVIPAGLTATATGPATIQLSWTDKDTSAQGYNILRSTDGITFTQIAQVTSAKTTTFIDGTVSSDAGYSYRVKAYSGDTTSDSSNTASATTPLFAPTALTAAADSGTSVTLNWTDNDSNATGYYVVRTTDGTHFSRVGVLSDANASTFTDSTVISGHTYGYEIQACNGAVLSVYTPKASANTPLAAPSGLTTTVKGPTSVQLNWTNHDANAAGYHVLRSVDGVNFTQIAKVISATAATYTDSTALSGHAYTYKVEAFAGTIVSAATDGATANTPLVAPVSLAATMIGSNVNLNWTDKDSTATGYNILRSTDGVTFTQLTQLTGSAIKSYIDTTVSTTQTYYYQVQATNSTASSAVSNTATITTPMSGTGGNVTITTRFGNELVITAAGVDDSVTLDESGSNVTITADGQSVVDVIPAAGLFVYTRGGSDSVTIDASVTARTTIETIDGAATMITSAGSNVSAWIDSIDTFSGVATVHRVASFAGGVSKALGASLANPKDAGTTTALNASLWGTGPAMSDVNQGEVGDCYFLSTLAAFANTTPAALQESAVDMGDGTFAVQFYSGGQPQYVRVNNSFSTGPFNGFKFASPGSNNTIWAMVMEKAFCDFRTGANTYASISSGWMGSVYANLNVNSNVLMPSNYSENDFYNLLSSELSSGKAVTLATSTAPNLVSGHAYTLVSVSKDSNGVTHYVVRNPWGVSGDSLENSQGYATLTFAQMKANFVDGCMAA